MKKKLADKDVSKVTILQKEGMPQVFIADYDPMNIFCNFEKLPRDLQIKILTHAMETDSVLRRINYKQKRKFREVCKTFNEWAKDPKVNKLFIEKFAEFRSADSWLNRDLEFPLASIEHAYKFHTPGAIEWLKEHFKKNPADKQTAEKEVYQEFARYGRLSPHPKRLAFLKEIGIELNQEKSERQGLLE